MKQKVQKTIQKNNLIQPNDKLVLAVSGGPDSLAMLDILNDLKTEMKFDFVVAHVNHMIREEAESDEKFVEQFCKKINVPFFAKRIDITKIANTKKIGLEEAGREERYKFFDEVMEQTNANKVAIAHNKNDKIETIIMNVLRGSGISGLKGIEPIKNQKYIRPLIECERKEIEEYCQQKNLMPRIDKTNFDNHYTRNKIRNVVIPYIKDEFNPNIISTIDRLSDLVKEEDEYIEHQVEKVYNEILIEEKMQKSENMQEQKQKQVHERDIGQNQSQVQELNLPYISLELKKFNEQEKVIKSRILLYTITRLLGTCKGIEKIHIEDIIKLCGNNIGNKYLTPNKNIKILVKNGQIYFIDQR